MAPEPVGGGRAEQNLLEAADGQSGDLALRLRVERPLQRVADSVVDEGAGHDLAEPQRFDSPARIRAHALVVEAADESIAFLECVGEDERLAEVHGRSRIRKSVAAAQPPSA